MDSSMVPGSAVAQEDDAARPAATTSSAAHDASEQPTVQPAETGEFGTLVVDAISCEFSDDGFDDTISTKTETDQSVQTGSDRDSAFGDDYESFTTSIKSTATDYKFEHGRRYHAYDQTKYALPNDDHEAQRLELQHRCWQLCLDGRLALAPLPENVRTALDIGCGTGSWVIDFAEAYPHCRVVGADLSPIQPTMVPPNVEFIIDDITSSWIYDHKFDYIHSRAITVGIRDWTKLVDEIWKNLEPGGWVEFQEYHAPLLCADDTMEKHCPNFAHWNREIARAAGLAGTKLDAILSVPEVLGARGFVHTGTASTKWPLGPWARGRREKKIGDYFAKDIAGNLEGVSMRMFTKMLGYSSEEVSVLASKASQEIYSGKMHTYMAIDFLWAQKPLDAM